MSEAEGYGDPNELFKSGPFNKDVLNSHDKEVAEPPLPATPRIETTQHERDEFAKRAKELFRDPTQTAQTETSEYSYATTLSDIAPRRQEGAPPAGDENLPKFDISARPNEGAIEQDKLKKTQEAWYKRIFNRKGQ